MVSGTMRVVDVNLGDRTLPTRTAGARENAAHPAYPALVDGRRFLARVARETH